MKSKFVHFSVIEGYSNVIERAINVDHVIQFEPNLDRQGTCRVYLTEGKVICVSGTFEQLINIFNS